MILFSAKKVQVSHVACLVWENSQKVSDISRFSIKIVFYSIIQPPAQVLQ